MASTLTRSSARSDGLTTRSSSRTNVALGRRPVIHNSNAHNRQQPPNIGRKKRARESTENEDKDLIAKKARIAIEIHDKGLRAHPITVFPQAANAEVVHQPPLQFVPQQPPSQSNLTHHLHKRTGQPVLTKLHPEILQPVNKDEKTVHQKKVANGIKHELDRLQPRPADLNKDEKRKLRSQECTRFKSELSAYFPEYDEVIGNEPKEDHVLNLDTIIIITDSAKISKHPPPPRKSIDDYPLRQFPDSLFDNLYDAKRVDFSFLDRNYKEEGGLDPLSDQYFDSIHRKPERLEKTIRNTDKGRAQHEKDQIVRLLEGLQGHDWLKLMGVSGVTESKKKEFEPARDHFIRGCEAILDKFKSWKDEEKRRKLEREAALAEAEEEDEEDAKEEEEEEEEEGEDADENALILEDEENYLSDADPPDYSDVDALVAKQLQEEVKARSAISSKVQERKSSKVERVPPPIIEKDFVSFFSKPHLRAAALGKHRRSGRSIAAWGQPIPEFPIADFDLPEEYRDDETLKLRERAKRRVRRVSKA